MDINLIAKLNAQAYAGKFIECRYLHIINLSQDESKVIVQLPLLTSTEIITIEEFKGILRGLVGVNFLYPCVGHVSNYVLNSYSISIDEQDNILINGNNPFEPTTIEDKVI